MKRIPMRRWQGLFSIACASLGVGLIAGVSSATEIPWSNTAGGTFSTGSNWTGGSPPGSSDVAAFALPNTYTINFTADATNDELITRAGDVTLDLGSHTYSLNTHLLIGSVNSSTVTVRNGSLVQSVVADWEGLVVGEGVGSTSKLVIDGAGVDIAKAVWIGNQGGAGRIDVINGGHLSARDIGSGFCNGPMGETPTATLRVQGIGSVASGFSGLDNGSALVSGGGHIDSTNHPVFLGYSDGASAGAVVTGAGSSWTGADRFTVGGVYHTDTTSSGSLTVQNGGLVSSQLAIVGNRSLSQGSVVVRGAGEWHADSMLLGDDGHGTVDVNTGGKLVTGNGGASIGNTMNGVGVVTLEDNGTQWSSANTIRVGPNGNGSLTLSNHAAVQTTAGDFTIGSFNGGTGQGTVLVQGGSSLAVSGEFNNIWAANSSHFTVDGVGSTASAPFFLVGNDGPTGTASATISNGGTVNVTTADSLNFGVVSAGTGHASLSVESGGTLNVQGTAFSIVGGETDATQSAVLTVAGAGSAWHNLESQIQIGLNGSLVVQDGGLVTSVKGLSGSGSSGILGTEALDTGVQALVTGAGSQWTQDGGLSVGFRGEASLTVSAGGSIQGVEGFVGRFAGSSGQAAFVTGSGSTWDASDSFYVASDRTASGGTGTLSIASSGLVTAHNRAMLGAGGTIDLTAGGSMNVATSALSPVAGTLQVGAGGLLGGNGTVLGNVLNVGGTVSPGFSPGILHVTGNYSQPSGTLLLELAGLNAGSDYDQLMVTGNIALHGLVQIALLNGFTPQTGDTFNLFQFGGSMDAAGATFQFVNAPSGLQYNEFTSNGQFGIVITQVPEPQSWILLASAALGLLALRRRGR